MAEDFASQTGTTLAALQDNPASEQAWSAFESRYKPQIYGWCRKWHVQEADAWDVTQNVLLQLWQKLRTFQYDPQKGSFRGWLKTLTRHALRDYLRKRPGIGSGDTGVWDRILSEEARDDLDTVLEKEFDREIWDQAQARVRQRVSDRDWQIFEDLALKCCSGQEVAAQQGMTVAAVFMAKCRVQKKLADEVKRLEEGETRDD